jgi:hypothetical protein
MYFNIFKINLVKLSLLGTFPNFYDVADKLNQLNMKIDISQS